MDADNLAENVTLVLEESNLPLLFDCGANQQTEMHVYTTKNSGTIQTHGC
jgi:hypothetical protein